MYRQAGAATEKDGAAKGRTAKQRKRVGTLLDDVARRTQKLNGARREATEGLETLTDAQNELRTAKATVQKKLAAARKLLSEPTAEERARLAAPEKKEREEAARKAAEPARRQAEEQRERERERERREQAARQENGSASPAPETGAPPAPETGAPPAPEAGAPPEPEAGAPPAPEAGAPPAPGAGSSPGTGPVAPAPDPSYAGRAEKALAFARAQIGKPYIRGATGPGSYDCSGLTRAAWKAAGVTLPRTTYDQAAAGTTVPPAQARPGDLVFFHDDVTHVGIYTGDGMMIHAPKPGTYVREESVYYDGESSVHSVVRPA
ncbi:glycoside hydrolase [Streptomyces sp. SW4]|nr:glycoside hydrolase [Streptomyces sp. SW4]